MIETTELPLARRLELLQDDTERLARTLETSDVSTPVVSCPGWTLGDLAYHVGEVHRFWTWIVREQIADPEAADRPKATDPPDDELASWLRAGVGELVPLLRSVDPATPVWSWAPQHEVAFVQRRMAHETSVHRWDAEDAVGIADAASPADLASDGVSEYFFLATAERYPGHARIGLRATDTGHEWTGWLAGGRLQWSLGACDAPGVLVGQASDLLLTLWRRREVGDSRVSLLGDRAAVTEFLALANLD